jgi:hypothetical protein
MRKSITCCSSSSILSSKDWILSFCSMLFKPPYISSLFQVYCPPTFTLPTIPAETRRVKGDSLSITPYTNLLFFHVILTCALFIYLWVKVTTAHQQT